LVVLASGTLGTPQILERSGVGKADLLRKLDIPVVSDLPGVRSPSLCSFPSSSLTVSLSPSPLRSVRSTRVRPLPFPFLNLPFSLILSFADHYTTLQLFRVSPETTTSDDFLRGDQYTQDKVCLCSLSSFFLFLCSHFFFL
jgi:alcohol oxidase